jgi:hypothetical protein
MTALEVISTAGLASGVLDLTATSTLVKTQGIALQRLLQIIASGVLGPSAFQKGTKAATLGFCLHFFIAFSAASLYYAVSRRIAFPWSPFISGVFYGTAVHLVMSRVVVPLSRAPKREFSIKSFLTQWIIHIVCVGLPIALTVDHFAK